MADDRQLLERSGFDLDIAVFLAELSQLAYESADVIDAKAKLAGFAASTFFDGGDVQGFWAANAGVALLAFRGTSNPGQWLRDAHFLPAPSDWGLVHIGFRDGVKAVEVALEAFDAAAQAAGHVWITGHSLGGALAVLAAARWKIKSGREPFVYTYGQPAVGLIDFAERFSIEMPDRLWRFVNQSDIVPRVPPAPLYQHVGIVKRIVRPGVLDSMQAVAETAPAAPAVPAAAAARAAVSAPALETAKAAADAKLTAPRITNFAPAQMTDHEFASFQCALNAGAPAGAESAEVGEFFPWISDHAIANYIQLLKEIRDKAAKT